MFRNRSEDRQRKLYVFQGECKGKVFGIVRSTWYRGGKICRVQETKLRDSFDSIVNTAKFSAVVGTALREGCDVSVHIECEPDQLGLEEL